MTLSDVHDTFAMQDKATVAGSETLQPSHRPASSRDAARSCGAAAPSVVGTSPCWPEPRPSSGLSVAAQVGSEKDRDKLKALMERYQHADSEAARELVEQLSPMLLRFLAGPTETGDYAQDMLQDCWVRIHRARHTYRPGSPLLPWVFAIVRHTRVDAYRRRSRIARHEMVFDDLESIQSKSRDPLEASHRDLWKLVQELPENQQEVVKLLKVAGMSLKETARATGSTVGSVKQRAHRAYQRLRKSLAEGDLDRG